MTVNLFTTPGVQAILPAAHPSASVPALRFSGGDVFVKCAPRFGEVGDGNAIPTLPNAEKPRGWTDPSILSLAASGKGLKVDMGKVTLNGAEESPRPPLSQPAGDNSSIPA